MEKYWRVNYGDNINASKKELKRTHVNSWYNSSHSHFLCTSFSFQPYYSPNLSYVNTYRRRIVLYRLRYYFYFVSDHPCSRRKTRIPRRRRRSRTTRGYITRDTSLWFMIYERTSRGGDDGDTSREIDFKRRIALIKSRMETSPNICIVV